jgi:hypothetical protein
MKKFYLVVAVFWMCITALYAQNAGEFAIGARAGALIGFHEIASEFRGQVGVSEKSLMNLNIAAYGAYAVMDRTSIQPELNFMISQGMERTSRGEIIKCVYSSLDIPVLIKYAFLNDSARFGFQAGPHVSIPIGKLEISVPNDRPEEFPFDGITFGLTAGLFGGFPVGAGRIVGDVRIIIDLSPGKVLVPNEGSKDYFTRRGLVISVGYEYTF